MKLVYIANKINGTSGLQRMIALQINYFIKNYKYEIDLILLNQNIEEEKNFFELNSALRLHYLKNSAKPLKSFYLKVKSLNETLSRINPNIIVACESDMFSLYLPKFVNRKFKMVYQRHDTKHLNLMVSNNSIKTKILNTIKKQLLSLAGKDYDKFVLLSDAHKTDWKSIKNTSVISNPIILDTKGRKAELDSKVILSVGRYDYVKGFDMLLYCWQKVKEKHPDWMLKIVGKRTGNIDLKGLAKDLNISDNVILKGHTKDISKVYLESSIYVCSSRLEGFPLVIIEAMSFGLPVVSFDCTYGPREIISDSVDGILVPPNDIDFLAESICSLIEKENTRKEMGERASENIKRYSVDKIMNQWKLLFEEVTSDA